MKYMGSKSRIAKHIVPILQNIITNNEIRTYCEPFVGGANVIDKIECEKKLGCDKQKYLIELFKNLDKMSELPEFVTKEHYSEVRESYNKKLGKFDDWYVGAIGFLASYNGRFFDGGYAGIVKTTSGKVRNYYDEAKRNLLQQSPNLSGIEWTCGDYKDTTANLQNALIYCDPPYENTKQYGVSKSFNHDEFWQWCRDLSKNNIVVISERTARGDFVSIWNQDVLRTIDNTKRVNSCENLFVINNTNLQSLGL